MEEKMLTLKEAMEYLSISRPTIVGLIKEGKLKSHRVGNGRGQYRISRQQLQNYLSENTDGKG